MEHTIRDAPSNNDTCLTPRRANATVISNVYEGIPETIVLNVICWALLLLLFAVLRNRAWDYGRLALVQTEKWTQLFYKNTDEAIAVGESSADISLVPETGCLWFPSFFKINKQKLSSRCGSDAVHYISFQEQLLILFGIITVFSICVILPINFQGKLQGGNTSFGHTTVSNLEPRSPWLWVHVLASFCFVPLTILIMRRSTGRDPSTTQLTSHTLMITHISHLHRNADDIKGYLTVRYPHVTIKHVQLAYRVKRLMQLEERRERAHEARANCAARPDMRLQPRGCIVCCRCGTVGALEYYAREEARLAELVRAERRRALNSPLGIAFVTVTTEEEAQHVISTFQPGSLRHWLMAKAPSPSDINWENLEISYRNWYSKLVFINVVLFLVLFFLTTPLIVVNIINTLISTKGDYIKKVSPLLADFLPTLLMLLLSALMPVLVSKSDIWLSHWTKSKQNHATMLKSYFYLLFIFLILPSLGLTSAQAFLESSFSSHNTSLRWDCIFLADKGAFFVNYVITSSLIGTALELLRFPELAMYAIRLFWIKSEAEKPSIRKDILSEFPFGIHYAWTLLIFTISTVYSLTCPLITPFGLLYLSLKHLVDKYNIYYVYKPIEMCGEGQQIHSNSVKMVRVAIFLLQLIMAAFSFVRSGLNTMTAITFLGCVVTVCFFFFLGPFPSCQPPDKRRINFSQTNERYIAPVLLSSQNLDENCSDEESGLTPTYGTNHTGVWLTNANGESSYA